MFILILFFILLLPVIALAQAGDLPPIFSQLLNEPTLAAIAAVVGITKLVRNALSVKGVWAFVITLIVAVVYSLITYGFTGDALVQSLTIGILSVLSFYLTKNIGKIKSGKTKDTNIAGKLKFLVSRKK